MLWLNAVLHFLIAVSQASVPALTIFRAPCRLCFPSDVCLRQVRKQAKVFRGRSRVTTTTSWVTSWNRLYLSDASAKCGGSIFKLYTAWLLQKEGISRRGRQKAQSSANAMKEKTQTVGVLGSHPTRMSWQVPSPTLPDQRNWRSKSMVNRQWWWTGTQSRQKSVNAFSLPRIGNWIPPWLTLKTSLHLSVTTDATAELFNRTGRPRQTEDKSADSGP